MVSCMLNRVSLERCAPVVCAPIVYHIPFVAEVSPLIASSAGVIVTFTSAILVSVVVAVHVATTKATRMKNLVVGVYMV